MLRGASHEVPGSFSTCHLCESTYPGFTSPGTFRLQGFSPSWRLTPRQVTRPCFMPERSWSSALQSFSLVRSHGASRRQMPSCRWPIFASPAALASQRSGTVPAPRLLLSDLVLQKLITLLQAGDSKPARSARLQGFAPRSESVAHPRRFRPRACSMLSWAFLFLRETTSTPRTNTEVPAHLPRASGPVSPPLSDPQTKTGAHGFHSRPKTAASAMPHPLRSKDPRGRERNSTKS